MFNADFLEFFSLLNRFEVEWMLIGGYAYQLHVEPRVTQDLDVWINPTREDLERLSRVAEEFVGETLDVEVYKPTSSDLHWQASHRTSSRCCFDSGG